MNKNEQYKRIISFFSSLILILFLSGVFIYIWYEYYSDAIVLPFYRRGNWVVIFIYMILTLLFFKAYGGLKMGYLKRSDMLYSQSISMVAVNIITYFQISVIGRDFMKVIPMIYMTAADLIIISVWIFCNNRIYLKLYPPRKLIIVYGSKNAETLTNKMSKREDKYMICESISIKEDFSRIKNEISRYDGVIICDISGKLRNDIIKYCFEKSKRIYISPKISDIIIRGGEDIRLFDSPLLLCRNEGLSFDQRLFKRIFDILFSVIGLAVLSPIFLIIAAAIKIDDRGKIFYKQKRLTMNAPELTEKYEKEMPEFRFRLKVKAGLTGYAQVTGVYDTTPYDKLKMDLMYIERYSMVMDLRLILMTLKTIIFPGEMNSNEKNK